MAIGGVYGFGFEGEDAEDALVYGAEGLAADEAFEGFDAEGELAGGEGTLGSDVAATEAG